MKYRILSYLASGKVIYLKQAKIAFLYFAKIIGLFHIANRIYSNQLLILCYHGFQIEDEDEFKTELFMRPEVFERRMSLISKNGKKVIDLDTAISDMYANKLQRNSVVITIDDGFQSVLSVAAPILKKYDYPSTLYITSYYVKKKNPVYRLVVQYMFYRTKENLVHGTRGPWFDKDSVDLSKRDDKESFKNKLISFGEQNCSEGERVEICRFLSRLLKVDYDAIVSSKKLSLIEPEQLAETTKYGIDIQLHTHRHRLPIDNQTDASKEIRENRDYLGRFERKSFTHFCYPSGIWSKKQYPVLKNENVSSATTCQPGLNNKNVSRFALFRILDSNSVTDIEFEAHLSGFSEILRNFRPGYRAEKIKHRACS